MRKFRQSKCLQDIDLDDFNQKTHSHHHVQGTQNMRYSLIKPECEIEDVGQIQKSMKVDNIHLPDFAKKKILFFFLKNRENESKIFSLNTIWNYFRHFSEKKIKMFFLQKCKNESTHIISCVVIYSCFAIFQKK